MPGLRNSPLSVMIPAKAFSPRFTTNSAPTLCEVICINAVRYQAIDSKSSEGYEPIQSKSALHSVVSTAKRGILHQESGGT